MKQTLPSLSPKSSNLPVLRWHLPPAVRSYEQIAKILIQRGEKDVTPSKVRQVCDAVSRKLRLALRLS